MNEKQDTAVLKQTFDTVSKGYDGKALRFFSRSAEHLCAYLGLRGDEHVLDVATGTGHAALAIARSLPSGRVTGVDFSRGMLDQARSKASSMNLHNVEFLSEDMRALGFPADHFDAAVCAFGIFFVEDMETQLAHIMNVVRSGGRVAISSFQESCFYPLEKMLLDRLAGYGVTKSPQTWRRVASEAGCRKLFEQAKFQDIRVEVMNVGHHLDSANDWWDTIWNAGFRGLVSQLPADVLEQFKIEHLHEVDALKTTSGIWLDVPILLTIGTKQ